VSASFNERTFGVTMEIHRLVRIFAGRFFCPLEIILKSLGVREV